MEWPTVDKSVILRRMSFAVSRFGFEYSLKSLLTLRPPDLSWRGVSTSSQHTVG